MLFSVRLLIFDIRYNTNVVFSIKFCKLKVQQNRVFQKYYK